MEASLREGSQGLIYFDISRNFHLKNSIRRKYVPSTVEAIGIILRI